MRTGGASVDLSGEIESDLRAIEESLRGLRAAHSVRIAQAARHNLEAGGKRLRPLLTCAVLRALGRDPRPLGEMIVPVELVHAASLLHDDVIDGAQTRRGRRSVHATFDVHTAILAGDLLLTWAVERLARSAPRELQLAMAAAMRDVCEGEVLERERRFDVGVGLVEARLVNRLKTATLFAYAAEAGALLAEAGARVREAARTYGLGIGEAFQVTDDLLDWRGETAATGKPPGLDLAEGIVTVPVALGVAHDPGLREEIQAFWGARRRPGVKGTARLAKLRSRLERAGAFQSARQLAEQDIERAVSALRLFPPGPWRGRLAGIAAAVVARDR